METVTYIKLMDQLIALFNSILPISQQETVFMKEHLQVETIPKNEKYCEEGKTCKKLGFVVEGVFKVVRSDSKGNEFIPYFITEGHFAVALESFTEQSPSEEYIEALTTCKVITMSKDAFDKFEERVINFSRIISYLKERALVEKHKLKSEMLVDDAETRYAKLVEKHPTIIQRVSQNNIAQFLGITPYTLSRIRSTR